MIVDDIHDDDKKILQNNSDNPNKQSTDIVGHDNSLVNLTLQSYNDLHFNDNNLRRSERIKIKTLSINENKNHNVIDLSSNTNIIMDTNVTKLDSAILMPQKKIDDSLEGRVLALLQLKYSQPQIVKILKKDGIKISQQTVSNIKRNIGPQRTSFDKIKFSRYRPVATPSTISKRRQRAPRLYRQLASNRYKNFITTDESWFYLDGTEGKRKVCYVKKSDPNYERMILEQDSSRPQGFMVWAGISSSGKTSLRFVRPGVKINSDYYINHILKPLLSRDIPRLFPKNKKNKIIFHQDSAPSHVSKKTIAFLNESKINYVKPEEWMPKSPDAAPMDYSIWGYLKQRLNKQKIGNLNELKKKLLYQWTKMDQLYIDKVLAQWPKRVFLIYKARAFHIEHHLK
ncbi:unnamed protein product [Rotaria socialis]|uniref:Uncharacterized protein n=2 Tax=Rotaria socialis TaxID=392032 RepID=A0A820SQZ7_9BILA|nr:unnamed protein product [Rotaria socialis]